MSRGPYSTAIGIVAAAGIVAMADAQTPAKEGAPGNTQHTIPGVMPERFRLPGTPTPTPTSTPAPTPSPAIEPVIVPIVVPKARPAPSMRRRSSPGATPDTVRQAPAVVQPDPAPSVHVLPSVRPAPAPVPRKDGVWGWSALAGCTLAALGLIFAWRRRLRDRLRERGALEPARPDTVLPPSPSQPSSVPRLAPRDAEPDEPFRFRVVAARAQFLNDAVTFDLEIELVNLQCQAADGVRPAFVLISANPDQDRWSTAFHGGPSPQADGGPIDLAPGAQVRLPVRWTLGRDKLHVVSLGGRPMFVAMLLIDLRWRGGLSIRRYGADFLLGARGRGDRPGPIWLDRSAPVSLAAIRYTAPVE